jgi:ParB family transcriptional regulator, chromosome partitioning protein
MQIELRKLSELHSNPLNPRGVLEENDSIRELANSIKEKGLLQPLLVTPFNYIIAGHRRHLAATLAGLIEVPVMVKDIDEKEQLEIMLIENLQREDLTPIQIAKGYKALQDRGMTYDDLSKKTGMHRQTIQKYLYLLDMPEELYPDFNNHNIPISLTIPLSKVKDRNKVIELGKQSANRLKSVKDIEKEIGGIPIVRTPYISPTEVTTSNHLLRLSLNKCLDKLISIEEEMKKHEQLEPYIELISDLQNKMIEETQEL